jgi:hypothetical protein
MVRLDLGDKYTKQIRGDKLAAGEKTAKSRAFRPGFLLWDILWITIYE